MCGSRYTDVARNTRATTPTAELSLTRHDDTLTLSLDMDGHHYAEIIAAAVDVTGDATAAEWRTFLRQYRRPTEATDSCHGVGRIGLLDLGNSYGARNCIVRVA